MITLIEKKCTNIMVPIIKWDIYSIGFFEKIMMALFCGPVKLPMLGLHIPYTEQDDSNIYMIKYNLNQDNITGNIIRTSLEWLIV